jgi:hypothetical protein
VTRKINERVTRLEAQARATRTAMELFNPALRWIMAATLQELAELTALVHEAGAQPGREFTYEQSERARQIEEAATRRLASWPPDLSRKAIEARLAVLESGRAEGHETATPHQHERT